MSLLSGAPRGPEAPPLNGAADVHTSRVLFIDDDASMRRFAEMALRTPGVVVDTASDGNEAVALMSQRDYDAIITDISMPSMSGMEVLRAARQFDPDVPVVLVTGSPAMETAIDAVEHGAFRYLLKPVSVADLRLVTERAICLHALSRLRRRAIDAGSTTEENIADRAGLTASFDRAIAALYMVYQPIVSSSAQAVFGYEALVRSSEPQLKSPLELLAAAEQLGRIRDLGRAVRSCVAVDADNVPDDAVLFVNVHPDELDDETLYLAGTPFASIASRVVLEITERASLDGVRDVDRRVNRLREPGFRRRHDSSRAAGARAARSQSAQRSG